MILRQKLNLAEIAKKQSFVRGRLKPLLIDLEVGITDVTYSTIPCTNGGATETIAIEYYNGANVCVDVSRDSCLQIVRDVMRVI